jgi:hypothetical protein
MIFICDCCGREIVVDDAPPRCDCGGTLHPCVWPEDEPEPNGFEPPDPVDLMELDYS